jgi:hypothetical protein
MGFAERTEKSLLNVFDKFAEPVRINLTKTTTTGLIGSGSVSETVILKNNGDYIKAFFINPKTSTGIEAVAEYDAELLVNDINFDILTTSFSVGNFSTFLLTDTLVINGNSLDLSSVTTLDLLISKINEITNVNCLKLSSTEFVIVSTVDDTENDLAYKDWRILKVEGTLDFSLIGILAKISGILAKNSISIFVISTFNTDYILVKEEKVEKAILVLSKEGYEISK